MKEKNNSMCGLRTQVSPSVRQSKYVSIPLRRIVAAIRELADLARKGTASADELMEVIHLLQDTEACLCQTEPSEEKSFNDILQDVGNQIDILVFSKFDRNLASDICSIIAEAYHMSTHYGDGNPHLININKVPTELATIREIYKKLEFDHIQLVIDNFKNISYKIKNKKAYLQTALYNAVFELNSHYANEVKSDFGR